MEYYFKESLKQSKKKAKETAIKIEKLNKDLLLAKQEIKENKFLFFLSKIAIIYKSKLEISVSLTRSVKEHRQWHTNETIKEIGAIQTKVIIIKNGISKEFDIFRFNKKEKKEIQSFIDT